MEQPDRTPAAHGAIVEAVEWLPSGDESDLVRVRGRAERPVAALPELLIGGERFVSLPDPRTLREPHVWRGAYLVPAALYPPREWWLEWRGGERTALGEPSHGLGVAESPARPSAATPGSAAADRAAGADVVDRAVLAERRARRAEAAEQAQARIAAQALKAVELMELRAAELERALETVTVERNELLGRGAAEADLRSRLARAEARVAQLEQAQPEGPSPAELAAALDAAARGRAQARDWRLHLRVSEIARTAEAVRLAVLEASLPEAARLRAELAERERELAAARQAFADAQEARTALDAEQERRVNAELGLEAARGELARLQDAAARLDELEVRAAEAGAEAARSRVAARIAETSARAESVARAALAQELDRTRTELERLRRSLTPASAGATSASDLARAAAEQAAAARATAPAPAPDLAADLDAAAEALRRRTPPPEPAAEEPPPVSAPRPAHDLPGLRGALLRLAREDPVRAGRLIVGLLPAQASLIVEPLAYDLTIAGLGTFAVSVRDGRADVLLVPRRRPRRRADFHLSGDVLALAELIAGREREIGRFTRGVRIRGRDPERLRDLRLVAQAPFTLAGVARAGARLDPDAVFRALPHAIDPAWTHGHSFTVAHEVAGEGTWYVTVADGAPVRVTTQSPPPRATATVTMSRGTFDALLRAETPPPDEPATVRGDHGAVALLRTWTDRAQGTG